jgi:hypothetical protein
MLSFVDNCTAFLASLTVSSFVIILDTEFFTRQRNVSALIILLTFSEVVTILLDVVATSETLSTAFAVLTVASAAFSKAFHHFTNTLLTIAKSAALTGKSSFAINLADKRSSTILQYCLAT